MPFFKTIKDKFCFSPGLAPVMMLLLFLMCGAWLLFVSRSLGNNQTTILLSLRQFFSIGIAFSCMIVCLNLKGEIWEKTAPWLGLAGLFLLFSVLLFGNTLNGMRGWFRYGFLSIQPSEICKPFFILWNAWLARHFRESRTFLSTTLLMACASAPWMLLIVLEPDLGTTLIYFVTFMAIQFVRGMPKRHLLILLLGALACGATFIISKPYAAKRITSFFHPTENTLYSTNWHASQMEKAMRHGGWLGQEHQPLAQYTALPYKFSDSMFAYAAEQMGFSGILPIILLPLLWLGYCCRIANHTRKEFNRITYIGTGTVIFTQAMIHLAVNAGLMPTTGVTLPLLSYGGSSLVATVLIISITCTIRNHETRPPLQACPPDCSSSA